MANDDRRLWTLLGLTAGAVVGMWLWARGMERAWELAEGEPLISVEGDPAESLARALAGDMELADFELEVRPISEGVVEITGTVDESDQRARAVAIAHNVGVETVVNRITLPGDEPAS
jgi:hypothetical protein